MKTASKITLATVAILAVAAGTAWWWMGRAGTSHVEEWIRAYLVSVVQKHLNPEFEIAELDYQYPRTVAVKGLRLRSDGVDILSVASAQIELAEIPKSGKPIQIERVELVSPVVHLRVADGRLAGWTDLVRREVVAAPEAVEPGYRVSDFLRMRRAAVQNASIVYETGGQSGRMVLAGIDFSIDAEPDEGDPGSYRLACDLSRPGLIELTVAAVLDVDAGHLRIDPLELATNVGNENYEFFPPAVQEVLRGHQVQGELHATATADLDMSKSVNADVAFEFRDVSAAFGGKAVELPRLAAKITIDPDGVRMTGDGAAFGGDFEFSAGRETATGELTGSLRIRAVEVREFIACLPSATRANVDRFRPDGQLSATAKVRVSPADWLAASGSVRVRSDALRFDIAESVTAESLGVSVDLAERTARWKISTRALDGEIGADGAWEFASPGSLAFKLSATDVSLAPLLAIARPRENPSESQPAEESTGSTDFAARMTIGSDGTVRLDEPAASAIRAHVAFTDAELPVGGSGLHLPRGTIAATLQGGKVAWQFETDVPGGKATATGALGLTGEPGVDFKWQIDGLRLERAAELWDRAKTDYEGRLGGSGDVQFVLGRLPDSLSGGGEINVDEANLLQLPIIGEPFQFIVEKLPLVPKLTHDKGRVRFRLTGDHVQFEEIRVESPLLAGDGDGQIYYDGRIDLVVRGGPLKKVEGLLGPVGKLLAKLSDKLMEYHIGGTTEKPTVEVRPLGQEIPKLP